MADLKHLGDEIRALLRQLNGRQKATLLAFGAVILVPLLWLSVRSTDESWLAVRDGAQLEPTDLSLAEQTLQDSGLTDLRVDGQRLFVPAEKVALANAALSDAGIALPTDDADENSESSIFTAFQSAGAVERESQNQLHRNIERALATISGIQNATVISSRSKPARWGQKPEVATAVYISPSTGCHLTPELRASICASVARMIPDLVPERIVVTDQSTGRSWTPNADGVTVVDAQELAEQYEARIQSALAWIPDAKVIVRVPPEFSPVPVESTSHPDPVGVRSLPNQPGVVSSAGPRPQNVLLVEVLVPNLEATETERVVESAERALPLGIFATVSVSRKPAPLTVQAGIVEETASSPPLLPALSLLVILASAIFAWRSKTASTSVPRPPLTEPLNEPLDFRETENTTDEVPLLDESEHDLPAASEIDERSFDPVEPSIVVERPQPRFRFLQQTEPRLLYRLLAGEHPQTLALVLRHLSIKLATDVVSLLPTGIQSEVIRRIAEADLTAADVVVELEETLRLRATSATAAAVPDISTATSSPPPHERFLSPMERFEEIVKLTPPNLKRVVEEVEESLWAEALHESSEALRFRVIASLPPQQARSVRARLSQSAPHKADVETTRNRIVETVNALRLPNDATPLRHEFVA